jgi:competence protein ComEC
VLAAVLFALGAFSFRGGLAIYWMVLAALVLCGSLALVNGTRKVAWLGLVPLFSYSYALTSAPHPGKGDLSQYIGRGVVVKARVFDKVMSLGTKRIQCVIAPSQMIFPDQRALSGQAELAVAGEKIVLNSGDMLKITGFVTDPVRAHLAWQTDTASLLAKKSVYSVITARRDEVQTTSGSAWPCTPFGQVQSLIDALRERIFSTHVANLGYEAASLFTSMVLGERAVAVDRSIVDAFRTVGLSHLIAASGFNLTVITAIAYWLARLLSGSKLFHAAFAMLGMVAFVLLAGLSPSVLRAALMCALVLVSRCSGRSLHNMAALALALFLSLLIDPAAIADPGCQLSYAATAGIICGANPLAVSITLGSMPKLIRTSIAAAAVVIAAQLAIVPIQLYYFWQIGLLFLPANLIVASMVAPVTVLGFVSSLVAALPVDHALFKLVPWLLDTIASYPLKLIILVAKYLASFDAAVIVPGPPAIASVVIYYLGLFSFLYSLKIKRGRMIWLGLFCVSGWLLFWRPESAPLSVGVFPRSIVFFNSDRKAVVLGERTNQLTRFLAYNGVRLDGSSWLPCKLGDCQFDEIVLSSSKSDFDIFLEHRDGQDFDRSVIGTFYKVSPKPQNPLARKENHEKPLYRIAVLESRRGEGLTQQIAGLKERGAVDWIITIEDDWQNSWRQTTIDLSPQACRANVSQAACRKAWPAVVFTLCPHRTIAVIPVQAGCK